MSPENKINIRENNEQQPSDKEIIQAGKEKGGTLKEGITKQKVKEFSQSGKEIVTDIKLDQSIKQLLQSENLKDPNGKSIVEDVLDNLKTGNWKEALKVAYNFLQEVFGGSVDKDGKSTFWFSDNNKEIQDIVNNVEQDPRKEQEAIQKLQQSIEREGGTKKKLGLSYAMSQILDRFNQRDTTIKNLVDGKTEQQDKHIALMSQSVEPGDIIAINKSEKKSGDSLLTELQKGDIDASHVMMVTKVDKKGGTVTFIHSTMNKLSQPGQKGVEQEVDFSTYAKQFNGLAVAVLKPPISDNHKQQYINNVINKDGKPYDSLSAMSQALVKNNMYSNNDKYNCVELIAESFIPPKKRTHPADMIKELTPKYVTIAGKSIGGS